MSLRLLLKDLLRTWDKEKAALEAGRVTASSCANDLSLELLQAKSYIHSTLSMKYG